MATREGFTEVAPAASGSLTKPARTAGKTVPVAPREVAAPGLTTKPARGGKTLTAPTTSQVTATTTTPSTPSTPSTPTRTSGQLWPR